jgi:hypothetical protein
MISIFQLNTLSKRILHVKRSNNFRIIAGSHVDGRYAKGSDKTRDGSELSANACRAEPNSQETGLHRVY